MNYIILDLEWDSAYSTKHKKFINQIIQIGAVKLDENLSIVDSFEVTVRSMLSKRVSGRFAKITGITTEKMRAGIPFDEGVRKYNEWVGSDTITMSWSTSDLFSILENEKLLLGGLRFNIEKYIDLQNYVQNEMRLSGFEVNFQISLADAAQKFNISTEEFDLHTAKDDSMVCVALLQKTYCKERFEPMINDTRNPEFYRRLCFKPYYVNDINDPLVNRKALKFSCEHCAEKMRRITKWRYRNRWFCADFHCQKCNETYTCRVSFRKNYDDVVIKRRMLLKQEKPQSEENDEMQPVPAAMLE